MDIKELKATALSKPQVAKLKALGTGIRVGLVWGRRLLVKPVVPYTDMDRVEKEGTVIIPDSVRQQNTPLPSTGIVVAIGELLEDSERRIFEEGTGVLFSKYAGVDFTIETVDYKIINLDEVLATFVIDGETEIIQSVEE